MPSLYGPGHQVQHDEMFRLSLSDGKHDAVLVHESGNNFDLYVVRKARRTEGLTPFAHLLHVSEGTSIEIQDTHSALLLTCDCEALILKDGTKVEAKAGTYRVDR